MQEVTVPPVVRRPHRSRSGPRALALGVTVLGLLVLLGLTHAPAAGAFGITNFEAGVLNDAADDTSYFQQAGGRPPYGITDFSFATDSAGEPVGNVKNLRIDIPRGLAPNFPAIPTCTDAQLAAKSCPLASQIGRQELTIRGTILLLRTTLDVKLPVYNMTRQNGQVARFAVNPAQAPNSGLLTGADLSPVIIIGGVRNTDYGLYFTISNLAKDPAIVRSNLIFWGVPGAAIHDAVRGQACDLACSPATGSPVADKTTSFLSNPTACAGKQTSTVWAESWDGETATRSYTTPVGVTGCDQVPFDPSVSVTGTATVTRDAPAGLHINLHVPQTQDATKLATAHVKDVAVQLPPGVTLSPSAANGLQACTDAQFGKGSDAPIRCPAASRIGTVKITTPLLDGPLKGTAYVGQPLPGNRYRLFLHADGFGISVRLTGKVMPDPHTGQLTTAFYDNPQLPFSDLDLQLDGGPRAILATPQVCGTYRSTSWLAPWSGQRPAGVPTALTVNGGCGGFGFNPAFGATVGTSVGGAFTPLAVGFERRDGDQFLREVAVGLPDGLLAKVKGVPRCSDAQVAAQACPASSQIGTATVLSGPGSSPYALAGPVYFTGPYKGAPFGMATIIHAVAGPYDLGNVVVRQAIRIDPTDAHVTVISDPLPQIQEGVVLRLRNLRLDVNRPGFTRNPTSCGRHDVNASLISAQGAVAARSAGLVFGACDKLPFAPRMQMKLTNRKQTKKYQHPGVSATVTQKDGEAGIAGTTVTLPKALSLAAANARGLCSTADAAADRCPKESIVGSAQATTPILDGPLKGPVYFVKGERMSGGRVVPTLPTLYVPLRGEVLIALRATTEINKKNELVTKFEAIPDAPISQFQLEISGGKHGIIAATTDICLTKSLRAKVRFTGHNGKRAKLAKPKFGLPCGKSPKLRITRTSRKGSRLTVSGTVTKKAHGRVKVHARCSKTTNKAHSVKPKKGRWSAKVTLKGRCATAKTAHVTARVFRHGKYREAKLVKRVRLRG